MERRPRFVDRRRRTRGVYPGSVIDTGGYGANHGGGAGTGQPFTRDSDCVNSMSNDFGTSGALGHVNGMPVTGH